MLTQTALVLITVWKWSSSYVCVSFCQGVGTLTKQDGLKKDSVCVFIVFVTKPVLLNLKYCDAALASFK